MPEPSENCLNCGRTRTPRNRRHYTEFKGQPLCANWRACYQRKTGHRAPKLRTFRRTDRLILADGSTSSKARRTLDVQQRVKRAA